MFDLVPFLLIFLKCRAVLGRTCHPTRPLSPHNFCPWIINPAFRSFSSLAGRRVRPAVHACAHWASSGLFIYTALDPLLICIPFVLTLLHSSPPVPARCLFLGITSEEWHGGGKLFSPDVTKILKWSMNDLLSPLPFAFPNGPLFAMPRPFFFSPSSSFSSLQANVCAVYVCIQPQYLPVHQRPLWEYLHIKSESVIILTCEMRRTQKSPGADIIAN